MTFFSIYMSRCENDNDNAFMQPCKSILLPYNMTASNVKHSVKHLKNVIRNIMFYRVLHLVDDCWTTCKINQTSQFIFRNKFAIC